MEHTQAGQGAQSASQLFTVALQPEPPVTGYLEAKDLADREAAKRLGDFMLMSWYDKDRDYESPKSAGECHQGCSTPGYVDYGLYHGATLKVDVEDGRFVFFYAPVQW